jgi:hypothetical protein
LRGSGPNLGFNVLQIGAAFGHARLAAGGAVIAAFDIGTVAVVHTSHAPA